MQRFFLFSIFSAFGSLFVVQAQNNTQSLKTNTADWHRASYIDSLLVNTNDKAAVYEEASQHFFENRNYDLALEHLLDAYEWNKMRGNQKRLNVIEFHLAQLYYYNENQMEALSYALKARNIFSKSKLDSLTFESNYLIGQIYLDQDRIEFSKDYTQEVFEFGMSANSDFFLGRAYFLKAKYELKKGDLSQAKNFLSNAQRLFKKIDEIDYLSDTYFLFGSLSYNINKLEQAKSYYELAYQNLSISKNESKKIEVLLKLALINERLNEKAKALVLYKQALTVAQNQHFPHQTVTVAKELMRVSLENKDNDAARGYLNLYNQLSDSILYLDAQNSLANKTAEKQLKSKDKALENYKKELIYSDQLFYGSVFIVVLLCLVLLLLYYNYKRRKQFAEQEKSLLKSQQDLAKAELNQTKKALENNNDNLKSITNLLIEKNAQIKGLLEQVETLKEHNSFSSLSDDKVRKVNDLLEFKILTDDDWNEFKKLYNQVYEGLQAKLKINHPNLTKSEVKLFMISKLNLSLEEAANLLAISPESVRKARYRLKKKLDLGNADLQEYIVTF